MIFDTLIAPIEIVDFFNTYWEKQHLVIKKEHYQSDHLPSLSSLDELLNSSRLTAPFIRIVKDRKVLDKSEFVYSNGSDYDLVDIDKVYRLYNSGATIIMQRAHLLFDNLYSYCNSLSQETSFRFNANIYITPPLSTGFDPHIDTHDAFILQVSGSKTWRIYNTSTNLPLEDEFLSQDIISACVQDNATDQFVLKQNDLLYIPRGIIHAASANESPSIHITLGLFAPRLLDVFGQLEKIAASQHVFRKNIPHPYFEEEQLFFRSNLKSLLKNFIDNVSVDDLFKNDTSNFYYPRITHRKLSDNLIVDKITLGSEVLLLDDVKVVGNEESCYLTLKHKELRLPGFMSESIDFVLDNKRFFVKDITGPIDDSSRVIFVRKLIKEGFITIIVI